MSEAQPKKSRDYTLPAVLIAGLIAGLFALAGYLVNANAQRTHERYVRKLDAYENLLLQVELQLSAPTQSRTELARALTLFNLQAPDNVIQQFNDKVVVNKENPFNRDWSKNLQQILHQDLQQEPRFCLFRKSSTLTPDDFSFVYPLPVAPSS